MEIKLIDFELGEINIESTAEIEVLRIAVEKAMVKRGYTSKSNDGRLT